MKVNFPFSKINEDLKKIFRVLSLAASILFQKYKIRNGKLLCNSEVLFQLDPDNTFELRFNFSALVSISNKDILITGFMQYN